MIKLLSVFICTTFISFGVLAQTKISGTAHDGAKKHLYLYKLDKNQPVLVDSVLCDAKENYSFSIKVDEPGFYRFGPSTNDFALLVLNSKSKKVKISSNYNGFGSSYDILEGSPDSKIARDFLEQGRTYVRQRDSINALYKTPGQNQNQLKLAINDLGMDFIKVRDTYIDQNANSPAVLVALQYINPQSDFQQFKSITESIQKTMPNSFYANALKQQLSTMVVPGNVAPEIAVADTSGTNIRRLSDLKGKLVLIDFWASWCRPCRAENPNVVRLYNKYNKDGFEVFSISMDKSKSSWLAAIKADNLIWPNHVSELAHWNSTPGKAYGVTGIPHTVLVGTDGKIIAVKLRGQELEAKLAEIYGY